MRTEDHPEMEEPEFKDLNAMTYKGGYKGSGKGKGKTDGEQISFHRRLPLM